MDQRGRLAEEPFSWTPRGESAVAITRDGRVVTLLRGAAASRFVARVAELDAIAAQHLMARLTGNFKHGNER